MPLQLTTQQLADYQRDGFLVIRKPFAEAELHRLERGVMAAVRRLPTPYPTPATQYTVTGQKQSDPDLLFIAEHPTIVSVVERLLGTQAVLSAFVSYLKTPGAQGTRSDYEESRSTGHNDYKTYHQAGSGLHWLFAIVPLCDLDQQTGPLVLSPGSHALTTVQPASGRVSGVQRSRSDQLQPFVDPHLRRGDLVIMHGFTWHEGGSNRSDHDRLGIYNKYRAVDAPPAVGPDLFADSAWNCLSPGARRLLPHHSSLGVTASCLLATSGDRLLLVSDGDGWALPAVSVAQPAEFASGADLFERTVSGLQDRFTTQLEWMTYVGDYGSSTLTRVYAHETAPSEVPLRAREAEWVSRDELTALAAGGSLVDPFCLAAVAEWDAPRLRGIGQTTDRAKRTAT